MNNGKPEVVVKQQKRAFEPSGTLKRTPPKSREQGGDDHSNGNLYDNQFGDEIESPMIPSQPPMQRARTQWEKPSPAKNYDNELNN